MYLKEDPPLDFDKTYPCPSCRQGTLVPITLTEAWGCDRCKQIFEQRDDPHTVGKLATPYHRQRTWRWNGKQWVAGSKLARSETFGSVVIVTLLVCLLWFGLSRITVPGFFVVGILALILLLVVMFWVLRRR